MRIRADVVRYFVGLVAVLGLAAGATVWAYDRWEEDTTTFETNEPSGSPSTDTGASTEPVTVTGQVGGMHIESASIASWTTPLGVEGPEPGAAGATITGVQVNGQDTSIQWEGGQPFELAGEGGGLRLSGVVIDGQLEQGTVTLGEGSHGFVPGTYTLNTPVAVGSAPADTVTFVATDQSTVTFTGGATSPIGLAPATATGSGKVVLQGQLVVAHSDGSKLSQANATLESGMFTVTFTRQPDGSYQIEATLQGAVTTS